MVKKAKGQTKEEESFSESVKSEKREGLWGNSAFVEPTDFGSHSMLHQTLILSSPPPTPSISTVGTSLPPPPRLSSNAATATAPGSSASLRSSAMYYAHHRSPLDGRMDALESNSFSPEETAEEFAAATSALVERDGFSVEDLLDLEEFGEADKDGADHEDAPPAAAVQEREKSNDDSQPSSILSYELPPPPPQEMVDLPAHDVEEELEWVSRIMDDSLSELPPQLQPPAAVVASLAARPPLAQRRPHDGSYRALPPAPVPPQTPTICALSMEALVPVKAKRSKRSRASGWSLSSASLFSDSASSSSTTTTSSCSSSGSFSPFLLLDSHPFSGLDLGEGYHHHLLPPPPKKSMHGKGTKHKPKKRGRKPKHLPPHPSGAGTSASLPAPGDRRCSHCGVQKTPQWRAGPEGAKTLCNACGVRYKSGRLLPEYRPACSPTFTSSIHSNSHRKVLEMRRKKESGILTTASPAVASF
ncbi:GATA transcription factor 5-like [Phragmites australis]|uniref:GATA transcription factor 5-like n=1 Tax=Phragmites australis TaxID=29695 RepID=UPI002D785182|nr:GATA transcription factor 5-like [Phragmites australis]